MKSLSLVYPEAKKLDLVESEVPTPKTGQVLCETVKSLISIGTEITCYNGVFDPDTNWGSWVQYPFTTGYSNTAVVKELGEGVTNLKVGDRVSCCSTHSKYFISDADKALKIPDGVSDEDATWVSLLRVAQNIVRKCDIQIGDNVVVIGAGQVGQLVIQFVKLCGATRIISIDPIKGRGELAIKSGATHVLSKLAGECVDDINEITEGRLADIVIDSTGHPAVLKETCHLARVNGKIGLVGDTSVPSQQVIGSKVVAKSLNIIAAHGGLTAKEDNVFHPWTFNRTNQISLDLIAQGKLDMKHLITNRYSPLEAPTVYADLLKDRSTDIGIIFDWAKVG